MKTFLKILVVIGYALLVPAVVGIWARAITDGFQIGWHLVDIILR